MVNIKGIITNINKLTRAFLKEFYRRFHFIVRVIKINLHKQNVFKISVLRTFRWSKLGFSLHPMLACRRQMSNCFPPLSPNSPPLPTTTLPFSTPHFHPYHQMLSSVYFHLSVLSADLVVSLYTKSNANRPN